MTKKKQAGSGREIRLADMNSSHGPSPANPRRGAVAIHWLAVLLAALVAMVLVLNRVAKSREAAAGATADQATRAEAPAGVGADAIGIPAGPVVKLAEIDDARIGSSVAISGKVVGLFPPPAGSNRPYALKVADDSGEKIVNFWQMEYDQIQGKEALNGAHIRARVSVSSYQGKLQLKLMSGADLEITAGPAAAEPAPAAQQPAARDFSRGRSARADSLSVGEVTAAQNGQTVRVRGRVASVSAPKEGTQQPYAVILKEGEASLRVTYWSNANDVIAVKPAPGAVFEMEGVVEVYKDKPQLKVESGYKVEQVEAASAPASAVSGAVPVAVPAETIASITAADKGQARSVRGTLGSPRALGKGTAFALTDDSGTIDLILWDSIVPAEVRGALSEGLRVSAAGVVGEFDGKLQLKANPGASVQAVP